MYTCSEYLIQISALLVDKALFWGLMSHYAFVMQMQHYADEALCRLYCVMNFHIRGITIRQENVF